MSLNFASEIVREECEKSHPDLKALTEEFAQWSAANNIPPPCITDAARSINWYEERGLQPNPHSWHLYDCARDFRTRHYNPEELAQVIRWWGQKTKPPRGEDKKWELITKLHGTGPHIHVARRDFQWKATYGKIEG